jgi:hypothetical protein
MLHFGDVNMTSAVLKRGNFQLIGFYVLLCRSKLIEIIDLGRLLMDTVAL